METDAKTINDLFLKKLDTKEGMDKVAAEGGAFVRDKLREASFARKILPPQYVSQADLQVSVQHDGVVKIVEIEPESKAMVVNFRGKPSTNYIEGKRVELPFHSVSSEKFEKTEEELLAYRMPLTKVIEQNSVLDIQKVEDETFLRHIDNAIADSSNAVNVTYNGDGSIPEDGFRQLFDKIDSKQLRAEKLLMDTTTFNRIIINNNTNDTFGDAGLKGEIAVNGYKYPKLFGRDIIVSNKTDLLADKIYTFTAPEYLGEFCILNDTKFHIDKDRNVIEFSAYETIGMVIANTKSAARMDLSAA